MRKLNFKAASAIAVGLSLSAALPTYAAAYDVSQADFDAAIGGTATKNINCDDAGYCVGEGDYTLTEDVDISADHTGTRGYEFDLNGNSSLDLGGHTFTGSISNDTEGANVTVKNGTVTGGAIMPYGAESFTISDVTAKDAPIAPIDSTLNIESGTYTSSNNISVISTCTSSTTNISGGTFTTTGDDIPVISANNQDDATEATLNITGGTFTSTTGVAIDFNNEPGFAEGKLNTNISGGTFTGRKAALLINEPALNNIKLSGGSYSYTDKDTVGNGAIMSMDGQASSITNLLADGYHFTNGDITVVETDYGATIARIGDTEVVSGETETETATDSSLKSPDTGVFTAENSGATATNAFTVIMVAAALGLLGYKKFIKR